MADDELGLTATDADSAKRVAAPPLARGVQLGRYTIERELGSGGMGVVYAAFDPELERRVALKVLRAGLAVEAEQRLLREARAMAKLASPNIVTVYDVGTTDGRDYIAMELIDGGSLDLWFDDKPDRDAVVETFLAAGRGLAAAHEAGLIHRDFKPHNVLRSKRGDKVVVTDFGLARDSGTVEQAPRTTPMPLLVTAPGSFIGTPAYMAPEQWTGGEVTHATDQFAFCIALWEGLTGARPFRGATADELRASVLRGLDPALVKRIPRRLRPILQRGLALDPAKRWPAMTALLARLAPRRRALVAIAAGGILIAAGLALVLRPGALAASCEPPLVAPSAVWGPAQHLQILMGSAEAATTLDTTFAHWQTTRASVCAESGAQRSAKLDCLDRVLLRFDAIRRGRLFDPRTGQWGVLSQIWEPEVCQLADPPRMPGQYSDAAIIGLARRAGIHVDDRVIAHARENLDRDPCAQAYFAFVDGDKLADRAQSAAQVCGDDQAYGAALLNAIAQHATTPRSDDVAALREAERAVMHAVQPFLTRQYYFFRGSLAHTRGDADGALGFLDRDVGGPPAEFELRRLLLRDGMLMERARPADLDAARADAKAMKAIWQPAWGEPDAADAIFDSARWWQGEVAAVSAHLQTLNDRAVASAEVQMSDPPVHGVVVDDRGEPVANAVVRTGVEIRGDAITTAVPLYAIDGWPTWIQSTKTNARGEFSFAHVARRATLIAQDAARRSLAIPAASSVRLVVAPTTAIRGHVRANGDRGQRYVAAPEASGAYGVIAPILPDGSFELAGVPVGAVELHTVEIEGDHTTNGPRRMIDTTTTHEIDLDGPGSRALDVVVRSATMTPIQASQITILAGAHVATTMGELQPKLVTAQTTTETARFVVEPPPALAKVLQKGDNLARARGVPAGTITVCALGFNFDTAGADFFERYATSEATQPIKCEVVDAAATQVVVKVPPMNRVE